MVTPNGSETKTSQSKRGLYLVCNVFLEDQHWNISIGSDVAFAFAFNWYELSFIYQDQSFQGLHAYELTI